MSLTRRSWVVDDPADAQRRTVCTALIILGGAGFNLVFACATPFPALATLAGLKMDRRQAATVIGLVWMCNQLIGYGVLGYPWTWDSLAWGFAIGLSAFVALGAANALSSTRPGSLATSLPFVGAFAAYEMALYGAGFLLPGSDGAFDIAVVRQIFIVNLLALFGLFALYRLALFTGSLLRPHLLTGSAPVSR
jgi:hypothetical protein